MRRRKIERAVEALTEKSMMTKKKVILRLEMSRNRELVWMIG